MIARIAILGICAAGCCLMTSGCSESIESLNETNDIIVRNTAEGDLWITVDGSRRGRVENNGIADVVWEDDEDGVHTVAAYRDSDYEVFHCEVQTDYLSDGEDYYWYLLEDDRYSGTDDGDC